MNKEKSLSIFNKNGTTLTFEKVTNFVEIAGNYTIAFTYSEANTQKRRRATFYTKNIVGYSLEKE
ncbi:hypothetical protein P7G85_10510 [Enterococcus faecalis]|uniref:hypothetical protein n=1 Tax=Enterococcus faecalis TaxID=1351 RepID=UPI000FFF5F7C|nr:hypothetical protein [Enterococcus faecalis]MDT2101263.1 hypothetical protein [Enterococcus faecalis]MDT2130282.1 hypothetical protein [Enterococcus faecalis]MDT2135730.1 hypothetical protein [Enterococcus faecalis]RXF42176.1 hypothetical protein EG872_09760 [Enterococcus faecalis]